MKTMKQLLNLWTALCAAALMSVSCEQELPVYSDETNRLNFYYNVNPYEKFDSTLTQASYSFVYGADTRTRDTLWYEVETMGKLRDYDRPITITQVDTTGVMAVPGTHYVPFDAPELAQYYVVKANTVRARIPVVILRDKSLKDEVVTLKFRITPNQWFESGYDRFQTRTLTLTDQLSKPSNWDFDYPGPFDTYTISLKDYFGEYGQVKHKFLISHTGGKWDEDYIKALMTGDSNYLEYLYGKMREELATENAQRAQQGLAPLAEADGTPVTFDE